MTKARDLANFDDAWVNYTPTFGGLSGSNSSYNFSAQYKVMGKTVIGRIRMTVLSGNPVSGSVSFSLPLTAADTTFGEMPIGLSGILDFGSQYYNGFVYGASTTTALVFVGRADSTYFYAGGLSASVPMTWTTNDSFSATFTYQAA